ncbi:MAG TPA: hypothetical protein DCM28_10865 [Phycisphaerales bacterium]|nr:hypothetical protein [Phycisphaerales bacterium]
MLHRLAKIIKVILIASVFTSPVIAGELECQITGRYKLGPIVVEDLGSHYAAGLTKIFSAPDGAHLELITAHATYTKSDDEKSVYNKVALKFFVDERPITCAAYRNMFGIYIQRPEDRKSIRTNDKDPKGIACFSLVLIVPDSTKNLDARVYLNRDKEGKPVAFPQSTDVNIPKPLQIGQVKVLDVKYSETYSGEENFYYHSKNPALITWVPTRGKFMLVKIQINFNHDIPSQYRSFRFYSHHFELEYANGQRLRPVGMAFPSELSDEKHAMMTGLREDQTWGGTTWSKELVFIVDKQDKNFKVIFWPQESKH